MLMLRRSPLATAGWISLLFLLSRMVPRCAAQWTTTTTATTTVPARTAATATTTAPILLERAVTFAGGDAWWKSWRSPSSAPIVADLLRYDDSCPDEWVPAAPASCEPQCVFSDGTVGQSLWASDGQGRATVYLLRSFAMSGDTAISIEVFASTHLRVSSALIPQGQDLRPGEVFKTDYYVSQLPIGSGREVFELLAQAQETSSVCRKMCFRVTLSWQYWTADCTLPPSGLTSWWGASAAAYCDVVGGHTVRWADLPDNLIPWVWSFSQGVAFRFPTIQEWPYSSAHAFLEMPTYPDFGTMDFSVQLSVVFDEQAPLEWVLIEKYNAVGGDISTHVGFSLMKVKTNQIRLITPAMTLDSPPIPITFGEWIRFTLTREANVFSIYVNGELSVLGVSADRTSLVSAATLKVGHRTNGSDLLGDPETRNFDFLGQVRDIMIFQRALSQAEIQQQMALYSTNFSPYCLPRGAPCPSVECNATYRAALLAAATATAGTVTVANSTQSPTNPVISQRPETSPAVIVAITLAVLAVYTGVIVSFSVTLCKTARLVPDPVQSFPRVLGGVGLANLCCGPVRGAFLFRLIGWVTLAACGGVGVALLIIGAVKLARFEGVTTPTTCVVASYTVESYECQTCTKGGCIYYTCYSGYIYTSCCGFCDICLPNQRVFITTGGQSAVYSHMSLNYPPGKEFPCLVRQSDGVVAVYGEIQGAQDLLIAGAVLFGVGLSVLAWAPVFACRTRHSMCFTHDEANIEMRFHKSQVKICSLWQDFHYFVAPRP